MGKVLTVGFEFQEGFYYSLIHIKQILDETVYKITVMNGNLERMLFGNNIIHEKEGHLYIEVSEHTETDDLKLAIAEALSALLNMPLDREVKSDTFY